jgi:hypothetical protein
MMQLPPASEYGLDAFIPKTIAPALNAVATDNMDLILLFVGREGLGKTTLATGVLSWCADALDAMLGTIPGGRFPVDNVSVTAERYISKANSSEPYTCHLYDEAGMELNARRSGAATNVAFNKFLMIARHLNQVHALCIPDLFSIDVKVRFRRVTAILSVYGYTKYDGEAWGIKRGLFDYYSGEDILRIKQNPLTTVTEWPHVEYEGLRFTEHQDKEYWQRYTTVSKAMKLEEGRKLAREAGGKQPKKNNKVASDERESP